MSSPKQMTILKVALKQTNEMYSTNTLVPFCLEPVPCHAMQFKQAAIRPSIFHARVFRPALLDKQRIHLYPLHEGPRSGR